jgi:cell division protein ZapA (FtsZ GTPase activity inhibitor)
MAKQIEVRIGKAPYRLNVEQGQEDRLREVALMLDGYVSGLQDAFAGRVDRDQILVLASLQMADEFYSLKKEAESQTTTLEAFHNTLAERLEKLVTSKI